MNQQKSVNIRFMILLFLVAVILFVALFADYLTPCDPDQQNLSKALRAPDMTHLLGTDRYGRDMLSRVIAGARMSVFSTVVLVLVISITGMTAGMTAGYIGGRIDGLIMRIADLFLAFPGIVFAVAVASVLGGGMANAVLALAVISWPKYARLTRSQVLSIKEMPYIKAARLAGSSPGKILVSHIVPNIAGPVLVTAMLDIGTMMMEIAGLSFLGLGARPPAAEWGSMMSNGRSMIQTSPWVILAPGAAVFITVAIFNLFGDALRDMLDPK